MIENRNNLKQLSSLTVLVVDDDPKQLDFLKNLLSHFFTTIVCASNGKDALDIFHSVKIDVVFTDYVMPIIDGLILLWI